MASTTTQATIPIIAIVGRPNVGKSRLFNRLIGKKYAITSKIPGTTRDRLYHHAVLGDYTAILVDTGGLGFEKHSDIEEKVQLQAKLAIDDADLIYFVVDASEELTSDDFEAAQILRKSKKPVILIANKIDRKRTEEFKYNLYELGFSEPVEFSAVQGIGFDEIISKTSQFFKKLKFTPYHESCDKSVTNLAVTGRPNVGKSSLINALLGEDKLIVSETPGTTRDTTDTLIEINDQKFNLIDTAGIRRRGKIAKELEKFSFFRSLDAIYRCDIVILMIDYLEGVTNQDCNIASYVLEAGKGLILAVNKSDLMKDREEEENRMIDILQERMNFTPWAPVIFISALTKQNIMHIFDISREIELERKKKIDDAALNNFLKRIVIKHPPPSQGAKFIKIHTVKQTGTHPPTFIFYSNNPDAIHFSYKRYLENELRKEFGLTGTSIRVQLTSQI